MTQSKPGIWLTDPAAYQKKSCDLLGNRDPIEVLAATPGTLAEIVGEHSAKVMQTRPFAGKWTPTEIIGHLTDTEWTFGGRMRMVLCEDEPAILGMDQEKWVEGQRHNERDPAELLSMFRNLREYNLHLWRAMSPADLQRIGQHNERGAESLDLMLCMEAGHDLGHIDQLSRYLAVIG